MTNRMTNEEAIRIIKIVLAIAEDFDITVQGEKFTEKKCKEAVEIVSKTLEQQPIIDKIRAEIETLEDGITSYYNDRPWIFKDEVLQIIDKYKAESEDKEWSQ